MRERCKDACPCTAHDLVQVPSRGLPPRTRGSFPSLKLFLASYTPSASPAERSQPVFTDWAFAVITDGYGSVSGTRLRRKPFFTQFVRDAHFCVKHRCADNAITGMPARRQLPMKDNCLFVMLLGNSHLHLSFWSEGLMNSTSLLIEGTPMLFPPFLLRPCLCDGDCLEGGLRRIRALTPIRGRTSSQPSSLHSAAIPRGVGTRPPQIGHIILPFLSFLCQIRCGACSRSF